ncbi:hypothetical protein BDN71DRAFT_636784 [Pleurotus eryngii]|uniref:Uncharacterized protein n=1 Tax=Pleurotus eryngii TaxID=5323 RepID=A0A9P6A0M7_PLEER|nr:hypothetical protein BDN71DRAFT_636784 [Pleurotus eryngii]
MIHFDPSTSIQLTSDNTAIQEHPLRIHRSRQCLQPRYFLPLTYTAQKREVTPYNPPNSTQANMLVLANLFSTICILGSTVGVTAGWRNITIDDQFGDERTLIVPTFIPVDDWIIGGIGGSAIPNRSLAYNGTWRDSTHWIGTQATSVNFGFTGACLYVYCVALNLARGSELHAFADYKLVIDGELVGRYTRITEETYGPQYVFNTLVYDNATLENKVHNFSVVLDSTEQPVFLLFEYAVYTIVGENAVGTTTPTLST